MISLFSLLLIHAVSYAKETRTKIAIVDTGYNRSEKTDKYLCQSGHKSFVDDSPLSDSVGHGTNIAGLVTEGLNPKKYCIIIIKFYKDPSRPPKTVDSIRYAVSLKISYMNLSLGGPRPFQIEKMAIVKALTLGVKIAVAAGNDNKNLDIECYYYPACYNEFLRSPRFHVVGSSTKGLRAYSNYGSIVKYREDGTRKGTPVQSGTSQATAIHLNKWIKSND